MRLWWREYRTLLAALRKLLAKAEEAGLPAYRGIDWAEIQRIAVELGAIAREHDVEDAYGGLGSEANRSSHGVMREFKVVLRGTFDRPLAQLHEELDQPEKIGTTGITGFDATRFVEAESVVEAIAQAQEGIKAELDRTVLLGRPHVGVNFELRRCQRVGFFTSRYPSEGFTFF